MPIFCRSARLLLLGGAAGDRYGRVRLLVGGTALFGAASIACALASSLTLLLIGRGLQGIGAAVLMPNSLAILGASFSGEARGRAIGIWASDGRRDGRHRSGAGRLADRHGRDGARSS